MTNLEMEISKLLVAADAACRKLLNLKAEKSILLACLKHFPLEVRQQYLPPELMIAIGLLEEGVPK